MDRPSLKFSFAVQIIGEQTAVVLVVVAVNAEILPLLQTPGMLTAIAPVIDPDQGQDTPGAGAKGRFIHVYA
jgi:hypothetical protein